MDKDKLHDSISSMITALGDKVPQEFLDRWNFITDIKTNDIRDEAIGEAANLWYDLKKLMRRNRMNWMDRLVCAMMIVVMMYATEFVMMLLIG